MSPSLQGMTREEKLALLRRLREEEAGRAAGAPAQAPATRAGPAGPVRYPVSFAQRRLWFLDRLDPGSSHSTIFRAVRLRGPLEEAALARAVDALVARHEALRTRFEPTADDPVQVVETPETTGRPMTHVGLEEVPGDEREAALARLARDEAARPFDLERAPLLRIVLVRLGPEDHALLVAVHHIVADGWSLAIFFRELSELYGAALEGRAPSLAPLRRSYGEIAGAQRERLDGAGMEREMEFWRRELEGAPDVLDLTTDRPRPALGSYRGDTVPVALSRPATAAIEALARTERATPFMVLLAAFAAVLGRWSRQRDVLVGVPVAGRDAPEAEHVVGLFANTLVVRAELDDPDPGPDHGPGPEGAPSSFRALLRRVRRRTLAALGHQETPFESLVEELVETRDLSRNPLFQAMFALQNMPAASLSLGSARIEPMPVERRLAKVDLTLDMGNRGGAIRGYLEYNTDLFDRATAERLAGEVRHLTEVAAADPDLALDRFEAVAEGDRARVLRMGHGPDLPPPAGATVDSLFRAAAAERPEHPAVETAEGAWSYRRLRVAAGRVAAELSRRGLTPGERVGVLAGRSPEAIAAFLGTLEAGGAYVPLDPEYPADRLAYMLADSGARLLLAGPGAPELPGAGVEAVPLDREALFAEAPEAPAAGDPPVPADGDRPAYVIYTSGTTGRPKGVAIPHRALVSHATGVGREYGIGPDDRVYQFVATSFDIAGEEIYPTLAAGATLHLRPEGFTPSPDELVRTVAEAELSVINVPTPLWHEWVGELAEGRAAPPPSLRLVVVGTEGALPERLAAWRESLAALGLEDPPRWINAYGPTEGTITATTFSPGPETPRRLHRVPIGRPVANVRTVVLGPGARLAGLGVPGELCLGGSNLALGYLGRPAATAEVFVPDPYAGDPAGGGEPGSRLYRTGDLVRQRPDGDLDFLGRTDDQVKVRGFRIEPAEVETVLDGHPSLREVAVVPLEAGPGDVRLVAYHAPVDAAQASPATEDELRSFLGERLPAYMIPAAFVPLDALPLTPAGKIDRKALPRPDWSAAGADYAPPRGPLEELVAGLWSEVLEVDRVGVRDDFFRLGGHSLLATRVVSRLRDRLGVEVPLRRLFETRTVEGLARVVAELRRGEGVALPPVAPRDEGEPIPASFAQQRLWFLDRLEPGSVLYNMPSRIVLEPAGGEGCGSGEALDEAILARAIGEIVRRHESLRTTFARRGPGAPGPDLPDLDGTPLQVIRPAAPPAGFELAVVDLSGRPFGEAEREAAAVALAEARTPFDLAAGPLARFRLLRLPGGGRQLLFTAHHTVSDGWSIDLFLGELTALYTAFAAGRPSPLPEPPVQYADFALWQRGWLAGEPLAALTAAWREALDGAPGLLELPTDRPRPPAPSGSGDRVPVILEPELTAGVLELARRLAATPFMVLLTAYAAVLARWSGQEDVPVGTPVAGRGRTELEGLIGFFANTLAVRADLRPTSAGGPSFTDAVARVRAASLDAFAHQDLPFEKLVEELQPERDLSHHPIFQVFFAYQSTGAVDPSAGRGGGEPALATRLVANDNRTARFDLALNLWRHAGRLRGYLEHATDLFDRATAARLTEHLRVLLAGAVAAPETAIADLPLLPEGERAVLLGEWNATAAPFPSRATLPELIAEQAARTPDRTALVFGERSISYRELVGRAARLAGRLGRLGVGRDDVVAVCAERSLEMVVALVGIQTAGAAYLPLDPAHPADRLAFMAEDAAAPVVLTQSRLSGTVPAVAGTRVIALDDPDPGGEDGEAAPHDPPEAQRAAPESAAYVIYTSGSTGRPKGVVVPHRGIVNRLVWMQRTYGLGESDRVLQKTPYGFDVSVWEFFWPLLNGARLVIAEPGRHGDAAYLADTIARHGVTTLHFVPSMLQAYLEHPRAAGRSGPRRVIASGEALPPSLARRFAERLPGTELHNLYGPTEASVDVTWHACRDEAGATVPIGRPIENLRVYVLDPRGRPAPIGVPGELHLAGVGLARGYLGRPALTAERFVPDPFDAGGRLYRTGDLCRTLADGEIEYLGRIDFQVKLRGLRIELGEIEAALASHPAVREAVVTAIVPDGAGEAAGEARLVAYVVTRAGTREADGERAAGAELRRHAGDTLPEYMIPSAFVFLDELPLSPNGKVDRKRLPAPALVAEDRAERYVAPRNPTEEKLAALWAEVLRLDRVGVEESFFELGGHSLKATQVMTRVEETFGFEVPLRAIFEAPTIAGLAERISELELETLDAATLAEALDEIDNLSEDELAALLGAGSAGEGDA